MEREDLDVLFGRLPTAPPVVAKLLQKVTRIQEPTVAPRLLNELSKAGKKHYTNHKKEYPAGNAVPITREKNLFFELSPHSSFNW